MMHKAIFILNEYVFPVVYPTDIYTAIQSRINVIEPVYTAQSILENLSVLEDVTMIFSGWGAPHIDATFLKYAPNLQAIFYGAGSIRKLVSSEFWQHNIQITSAYAINSEPVAQFTFAQVILALKGGWHSIHLPDVYNKSEHVLAFPGIHGATIGIISFGAIGRRVCELLRPFNFKFLIYDPYLSSGRCNSTTN